jgi:hypothetical protein
VSLGEHVVASGQFLIDSEASLRGALNSLAGGSSSPETNMDVPMGMEPGRLPSSSAPVNKDP